MSNPTFAMTYKETVDMIRAVPPLLQRDRQELSEALSDLTVSVSLFGDGADDEDRASRIKAMFSKLSVGLEFFLEGHKLVELMLETNEAGVAADPPDGSLVELLEEYVSYAREYHFAKTELEKLMFSFTWPTKP